MNSVHDAEKSLLDLAGTQISIEQRQRCFTSERSVRPLQPEACLLDGIQHRSSIRQRPCDSVETIGLSRSQMLFVPTTRNGTLATGLTLQR